MDLHMIYVVKRLTKTNQEDPWDVLKVTETERKRERIQNLV